MGKLNKKKNAALKKKKQRKHLNYNQQNVKKKKTLQTVFKQVSNVSTMVESTVSAEENVKNNQGKNMQRKSKHGKEIFGLDVTDIGLEELKTWGIENEVALTAKDSDPNSSAKDSSPNSVKTKNVIPKKNKKLSGHRDKDAQQHQAKVDKNNKDSQKDRCADMSAWRNLYVPDPVMEALAEIKFSSPTPIQTLCLPSAIRDRLDIVGAAETGSGKTLAFGIPVVHNILEYKRKMQSDANDEVSSEESDMDAEDEENEANYSESDTSISDTEEGDKHDDISSASNSDSENEQPEGDGALELDGGEQVSGANIEQIDVFGVDLNTFDANPDVDEDELDLPPDEEVYDDLADDELGCVQVINDVEFDWIEKPKKLKAKANRQAPLFALVLCPTRELAMQVTQHLKRIISHTDIKVATVIGGMAVQKQERLLKKCPEIVVATPGRLWELIQEGQSHLAKVEYVRNLVIDEADRMVEKGHFQELIKLLDMINSNEALRRKRQTFVFSATLTLAHGGPERMIMKKKKRQKFKKLTEKDKLESLMYQIGLKDKPKIIDLTRKQGTAETLVESRIVCDKNEKDLYLYYFKQQYSGRTLVFTNSKDCIRRLASILTLLECNPLPLHSDMHQTQRLKNLDRFKESANGFLLATDVAARGLDIPDVQHVIHYQVPRTTENYIHRSGRTARASKEGLSIMLVSPEDLRNYRKIIKTLNRDEELPLFPVEPDFLSGLKQNLNIVLDIDKLEHQQSKQKKENSWFEKAAREMDMELDEDKLLHDMGDSHHQALQRQKIKYLKMELKALLKRPVMSHQFSGRYPTKSGKLVVPYMSVNENKDAVTKVKADIKKAKTLHEQTELSKDNKLKQLSKKKQKYLKRKKYFPKTC